MKNRRNDPCPCGSGKKYKKCCLIQSSVSLGLEDVTFSRLLKRLQLFVEQRFDDEAPYALEEFFGEINPLDTLPSDFQEPAEINFVDWMIFDWSPENDGRTVIDHFVDSEKNLSERDRSLLKRMNNSFISLYEVVELFSGRGFILRDLIRKETVEVTEITGSKMAVQWDIMAVRLLQLDGKSVISGGSYSFPQQIKGYLLDELFDDFADYLSVFPENTMNDFLKSEGTIFNHIWMRAFESAKTPTLKTTAGESMIFAAARFKLNDCENARKRLSKSKEFDHDEGNNIFIWLGPKPKKKAPIILGTVTVGNDFLLLECQSKERLINGKKALETILGDTIKYSLDSFEDINSAMRRIGDNPPEDDLDRKEDIPVEEERELLLSFKREHYEKTLKERIPMLDNKTPRQALRSKSGRLKVIDWLKLLENHEEQARKSGQPALGMRWMWEKLGLSMER